MRELTLRFEAGTLAVGAEQNDPRVAALVDSSLVQWDARTACYRAPALHYAAIVLTLRRATIPYEDGARRYEELAHGARGRLEATRSGVGVGGVRPRDACASAPAAFASSRNRRPMRMGPTVCDEDGPMPILKMSKTESIYLRSSISGSKPSARIAAATAPIACCAVSALAERATMVTPMTSPSMG